jgi:hypothetical protein
MDKPEVLALRLVTVKRLYGELGHGHKTSNYLQTDEIIDCTRAELKEIELLIHQAQLFGD